jgi:hypothetical protein
MEPHELVTPFSLPGEGRDLPIVRWLLDNLGINDQHLDYFHMFQFFLLFMCVGLAIKIGVQKHLENRPRLSFHR